LASLGVPEDVLKALPTPEPDGDIAWLVALTDAIAAVMPEPVELGGAHVSANGAGLRGVLALLELGVQGIAPQTLVLEGRAVPATATELALVIRSALMR
jgi:hypothetical protein